MQFQRSGTIYTQIIIVVSIQCYSNASVTMYCIRADMNLKDMDHCLFSALAKPKQFFHIQGKFRIKKKTNSIQLVFLIAPNQKGFILNASF